MCCFSSTFLACVPYYRLIKVSHKQSCDSENRSFLFFPIHLLLDYWEAGVCGKLPAVTCSSIASVQGCAPEGQKAVWGWCTVQYYNGMCLWRLLKSHIFLPRPHRACSHRLISALADGLWNRPRWEIHCQSNSRPPTLLCFSFLKFYFFLFLSVLVCSMCYSSSDSNWACMNSELVRPMSQQPACCLDSQQNDFNGSLTSHYFFRIPRDCPLARKLTNEKTR